MKLNEYDIKIITTVIKEELEMANLNDDVKWIKELSNLLIKIEGLNYNKDIQNNKYEIIYSIMGNLVHTHWSQSQIDEQKQSSAGVPFHIVNSLEKKNKRN